MADFYPDRATGLEADAQAKLFTGSPAQAMAAFYAVIRDRFANGSKLVLTNTLGAYVEIPMPAGSLVGDRFQFPAFSGTATASGAADIDNGTWTGRIYNGDRYLESVTTPSVGRSAPAAIRLTGGSISPGVVEFATGPSSVAVAATAITLPPASHFGVAAPPPPPPPAGVPQAIIDLPTAPKQWTWTTSSGWSGGTNYIISGSFIAESNGSLDPSVGIGFGAFPPLDQRFQDSTLMRVGIGAAVGNNQVASFRLEANIPVTANTSDNVRGYPSVGLGQQGGWSRQIPDSGTWWDNIPTRVSAITSGWTGCKSLNIAGTTCKGHVAHDMRFVTTPVQTSGNYPVDGGPNPNDVISIEWLIQQASVGGYGVHPTGKDANWYRGPKVIDGFTWHMYLQPGAQTTLFQWIPNSYPAPNWINIGAMIAYGRSTTFNQLPNGAGPFIRRNATANSPIFDPNAYFISNTIGYEICGPGALRAEFDSATLRINRD